MVRPRTLIVFNPVAGGGRAARVADAMAAALTRQGLETSQLASERGAAESWLREPIRRCDLIVVAGGDGALRQVLPAAIDARCALWHAPSGTENLFPRSVGMGAEPESLIEALRAARIARIDIGTAQVESADGREGEGAIEHFTLMASCGFDAEVVTRLASVRRGPITHLSYMRPILWSLFHWWAPRLRVMAGAMGPRGAAGGPLLEGRGTLIVANAPAYAFRMNPVPWASLESGALDIRLLRCMTGAGALLQGLRLRALRHRGARETPPPGTRSREFTVLSDRPIHWQLDGDPTSWGRVTRVRFRVLPAALPILLPAPTARPDARPVCRSELWRRSAEWTVGAFEEVAKDDQQGKVQ